MPVIVIGADTEPGRAIVAGLVEPEREVRAFVSDPVAAEELKRLGVKVAVGDVSDETHIEAASTRCFSAVMIEEAAGDQRERAFAPDPSSVQAAWARGISASAVTRAIWVTTLEIPPSTIPEVAVVHPDDPDLVTRVKDLDDAREIARGDAVR